MQTYILYVYIYTCSSITVKDSFVHSIIPLHWENRIQLLSQSNLSSWLTNEPAQLFNSRHFYFTTYSLHFRIYFIYFIFFFSFFFFFFFYYSISIAITESVVNNASSLTSDDEDEETDDDDSAEGSADQMLVF